MGHGIRLGMTAGEPPYGDSFNALVSKLADGDLIPVLGSGLNPPGCPPVARVLAEAALQRVDEATLRRELDGCSGLDELDPESLARAYCEAPRDLPVDRLAQAILTVLDGEYLRRRSTLIGNNDFRARLGTTDRHDDQCLRDLSRLAELWRNGDARPLRDFMSTIVALLGDDDGEDANLIRAWQRRLTSAGTVSVARRLLKICEPGADGNHRDVARRLDLVRRSEVEPRDAHRAVAHLLAGGRLVGVVSLVLDHALEAAFEALGTRPQYRAPPFDDRVVGARKVYKVNGCAGDLAQRGYQQANVVVWLADTDDHLNRPDQAPLARLIKHQRGDLLFSGCEPHDAQLSVAAWVLGDAQGGQPGPFVFDVHNLSGQLMPGVDLPGVRVLKCPDDEVEGDDPGQVHDRFWRRLLFELWRRELKRGCDPGGSLRKLARHHVTWGDRLSEVRELTDDRLCEAIWWGFPVAAELRLYVLLLLALLVPASKHTVGYHPDDEAIRVFQQPFEETERGLSVLDGEISLTVSLSCFQDTREGEVRLMDLLQRLDAASQNERWQLDDGFLLQHCVRLSEQPGAPIPREASGFEIAHEEVVDG